MKYAVQAIQSWQGTVNMWEVDQSNATICEFFFYYCVQSGIDVNIYQQFYTFSIAKVNLFFMILG